MAKRTADDDSASDMEAGMTTAERRRRRRRGGGIRVPSDNVPRSRTPTAPPPPRPEDPALAMSIAYSFTNDASGPVPRHLDARDGRDASGPATIADPQANGDSSDFESKTREMSAVDLEALGLTEPRTSSPGMSTIAVPRTTSDVDVDVDVDAGDTLDQPIETNRRPGRSSDVMPAIDPEPEVSVQARRLQTVTLSEDDLEEVRASTAPVAPRPKPASAPPPLKPTTKPPPLAQRGSGEIPRQPVATPPHPTEIVQTESQKTQQLQAVDIEVIERATPSEPISAAEIDLSELAIRAESSGEIEVDVEDSAPPTPPPAAQAKPAEKPVEPKPEPEPKADPLAPTQPLAVTQKLPRAQTAPPSPPPSPPAKPAETHAAPPPPPPAAAKLPPTPPPTVKKPPPVDKSTPTSARGKPWFVDLFDEDYLRTLPFLTPQATQAEAEFVIDTLTLAPGAQVLDVGCGYGRHAMELAARGFHVVGLDLSTPLLLRGGEEAARRNLTINFIRGDMRELDFENQFDAAYCLFSTFGYFDDETNKKALQNIARALKPNGKVVIEILNRDYLISDLPTRVWWEGDGCVVLEEVELNYFSSRIQVNRSVVFDDGRQLEQEISVRAYSLHEVGKLMHAAGFRVLEVSGGYQTRGRFFGNQSRHIIVLAERKETSS